MLEGGIVGDGSDRTLRSVAALLVLDRLQYCKHTTSPDRGSCSTTQSIYMIRIRVWQQL
jgi:hypothetical protein